MHCPYTNCPRATGREGHTHGDFFRCRGAGSVSMLCLVQHHTSQPGASSSRKTVCGEDGLLKYCALEK